MPEVFHPQAIESWGEAVLSWSLMRPNRGDLCVAYSCVAGWWAPALAWEKAEAPAPEMICLACSELGVRVVLHWGGASGPQHPSAAEKAAHKALLLLQDAVRKPCTRLCAGGQIMPCSYFHTAAWLWCASVGKHFSSRVLSFLCRSSAALLKHSLNFCTPSPQSPILKERGPRIPVAFLGWYQTWSSWMWMTGNSRKTGTIPGSGGAFWTL